jgi:Acetyltransferase (GNAT) domain
MSLAVQTPKIELRLLRASASNPAWSEIRQQDLPLWNEVLLSTDTWIYQYPFWNEPYRRLRLTPRYLAWGTPDRPLAYVCILTAGFRRFKIGLVFRGPACLQAGAEIPQSALAQLMDWARNQGYIFIRFTHSDPEVLSHIASVGHARDLDAFPYLVDYPILSPDFVVAQLDTEAETLASFDREVRRKLRRASEIGYEFRSDDSPEALQKLWPLYQECSERKHFRLERPLSVYMEMLRLARPHNCARVYGVHLDGKAVGSALVVRDGASAHCVLAAFDAAHRKSAAFLHWRSMRDMFQMGARYYNLGPGPGSLARFKQQFSGQGVSYPGPLTVVLKEKWFQFWWKAAFPVAKSLRPLLRGSFFRVHR